MSFRTTFGHHQKIVGVPTESLSLKMYLDDYTVEKNRWNGTDEQLRQPIGIDMLLKERPSSTGRGRARNLTLPQHCVGYRWFHFPVAIKKDGAIHGPGRNKASRVQFGASRERE
ncbi:MAG: hypothetical protein ACKV2Q_11620 [Planctomycetaceae bacterium]